MKIVTPLTLLSLIFVSVSPFALPIYYQSEMDKVNWQHRDSFDACEIYAEIQELGIKVSLKASPSEAFSLVMKSNLASLDHVTNSFIKTVRPPWFVGKANRSIEIYATHMDAHQIIFENDIAGLYQSMLTGSWLQLSASSKLGKSHQLILPSTLLQKSNIDFQRCVNQLPTISYEDIQNLSFHFVKQQYSPNSDDIKKLIKVADYIKKDSRINKVLIDGHTDSSGNSSQNVKLSQQRAKNIADILFKHDIAAEMVEVRGHGGRYPIADNNTKRGQKTNRRVTLKLVKSS